MKFVYGFDDYGYRRVRVQQDPICPQPVPILAISFGILGGLLLLGLLLLLLYKLSTHFYDKKQYARFLEDQKKAKWNRVRFFSFLIKLLYVNVSHVKLVLIMTAFFFSRKEILFMWSLVLRSRTLNMGSRPGWQHVISNENFKYMIMFLPSRHVLEVSLCIYNMCGAAINCSLLVCWYNLR